MPQAAPVKVAHDCVSFVAFMYSGMKSTYYFLIRIIILSSGKVEMGKGIHAVFHNMPLMWTPGYLSKGLDVMERVCNDAGDMKLCKEIVSM